MHICHITTIHPQQDTRIFQKQCVSWASAGHQVTLICAKGNSQTIQGVDIISIQAENFSFSNRIKNIAPTLYGIALKLNADVYQFHDPDFLWFALKLRAKNKKVVYDIHEDIPRQLLSKPYGNKLILKLASSLFEPFENYVAKRMSAVITADQKVNDRFNNLNIPATLISNYPDLSRYTKPVPFNQKENEVFYVGDIAYIRGAVEMVKAIALLDNTKLVLAGKIDNPDLRRELENLPGWEKTRFEGFVNAQKRDELLQRAKIGIVALHPVKKYEDALPTKLFEYMAAGLAVVCTDLPLWTNIIKNANCGLSINPLNPTDIAEKIKQLLDNEPYAESLGQNGYNYTQIHYSWEPEFNKLQALFKQLN